jgi:thiol-disulfide isomerase/thioredoxin
MVQGSYCGHCTKNKPTYAQLSSKFGSKSVNKGPVFATIQIDGSEREQALAKRLPGITKTQLSGVPAFMKFEDGKFTAMVVGGKNEGELIEFMKN